MLQPGLQADADPVRGTRSVWVLLILAGLISAWFLLIRRFGEGDVYAVLGPFACLVCAVTIALRPRAVRCWFQLKPRAIAIGLLVGVGMTVLTYPIFHLAAQAWPGLDSTVKGLYAGARSTTLPKALAWVVAIIVAEELLFRGVWPDALSEWISRRAAYGLSLLTYALAQCGTGSSIVMLTAAVCGSIWTIQRCYTGSVLSALIAHLIWTPTVILLYPVT
jgi:membrane protease YdiL (CAAX protease family)